MDNGSFDDHDGLSGVDDMVFIGGGMVVFPFWAAFECLHLLGARHWRFLVYMAFGVEGRSRARAKVDVVVGSWGFSISAGYSAVFTIGFMLSAVGRACKGRD